MEENVLDISMQKKAGETRKLPKAVNVLVLGAVSIVTSMIYGIPGIIIAIIALVKSKKPWEMYLANPEAYDNWKILRAGRRMAISGLIVSSVIFLGMIIFIFALVAQESRYYY